MKITLSVLVALSVALAASAEPRLLKDPKKGDGPRVVTPVHVAKTPTILRPRVTSPFFVDPVKQPPLVAEKVQEDPFKEENKITKPPLKQGVALALSPITEQTAKTYLSFWPKSDDDDFNAFGAGDVILYDDESTPRIYQVWDKGNRSGFRFVAGGQRTANNEFPWKDTAGVDSRTKIIRAVHLPGPIQWWRENLTNGTFNGFRWEYPNGTKFAEVLLVTDESGNDWTFEVRTRTKSEAGNWLVDVLRPYPREDDLVAALDKLGYEYPKPQATVFTKESRNRRESDGRLVTGIVQLSGAFVNVPAMPPDVVRKLLTEATFKSAKGLKWRVGETGTHAFAPGSATSFSIVPRNYEGAFLRPSSTSCMRCHNDAGKVVVEPGDERWRIRGDDAIFSFHIFDRENIARGELSLNPALVERGLLKHKDGMP